MSVTCTISTSVSTAGSRPLSGAQSETGSAVTEINQNFAGGTVRSVFSIAFAVAALQLVDLVADQPLTIETNGTDEVEQIAVSGSPTGGGFTSTFSGQTTATIAYNATAAAVQAALEALSNIAVGDVVCTGGPLPATPVSVAFKKNLGLQNVSQITTTDSFTGGSSPASAVTTTTPGVAPDNTFELRAGMPLAWGVSAGYFPNPFTADVTRLSLSCATATRLQGKILTA